jgi:aminoglycoside phosphotransferase (APT) family kinase protein
MDRVEGRAPTDTPPYTLGGWLSDEATPDDRRTLVENGIDALVTVHAVDWQGLGLGFLSKPQYGGLGFEQQLRYYEAAFEWANPDRPAPPVARAALDWVRAHAPAADPEITLAWGDARINNQLFDAEFRVAERGGARLARMVREVTALEASDQARLLDESLPAGLRLRATV